MIIQLYLSEVDEFWTRVVDSGAQVVVPLADTYWGERFGRFVDPFGHVWNIAKRTEMLTPGEIAERATATFQALEPLEVIDGMIDESPQLESEPVQSIAQ